MKRAIPAVLSAATALTLVLAGCGGGDEPSRAPTGPVTHHPGRLEPGDHAGVQDARRRLQGDRTRT